MEDVVKAEKNTIWASNVIHQATSSKPTKGDSPTPKECMQQCCLFKMMD